MRSLSFALPEKDMRKKILDLILRGIEGIFDTEENCKNFRRYSGSDLRLIVREAVLNGLITERTVLTQQDLLRGVTSSINGHI